MRQRRVKSDYKPWLTDQIKKLCHQRDFLKKQAVKFRSAAYDSSYKRHKNYVSRFIKTAKEDYFKMRSLVMQKTVMTVGRQLTATLIKNLNPYKYLS